MHIACLHQHLFSVNKLKYEKFKYESENLKLSRIVWIFSGNVQKISWKSRKFTWPTVWYVVVWPSHYWSRKFPDNFFCRVQWPHIIIRWTVTIYSADANSIHGIRSWFQSWFDPGWPISSLKYRTEKRAISNKWSIFSKRMDSLEWDFKSFFTVYTSTIHLVWVYKKKLEHSSYFTTPIVLLNAM